MHVLLTQYVQCNVLQLRCFVQMDLIIRVVKMPIGAYLADQIPMEISVLDNVQLYVMMRLKSFVPKGLWTMDARMPESVSLNLLVMMERNASQIVPYHVYLQRS